MSESIEPVTKTSTRNLQEKLLVVEKMTPGVNLSSTTSVLEFCLRGEFRAKTKIIRESLFFSQKK